MFHKNKINAIHVGVTGFPYGSAPINRCLFIYKSLVENGVNFLFINNKAIHNNNIPIELKKKGNYNGVNYIYTTPSPYKYNSFLKKRISNILGIINEVFLIIKLKFSKKLDVVFYYPDGKLSKLFYYRFLSIIFHFPIISHYVEYRSVFESRKGNKLLRFSDSFFDRRFTCFVDAVIPISEFLIERLKENMCCKPYLKVPPLTDFNLFKVSNKSTRDKYFLYCGSAGYSNAYQFIIKAFEKINNKDFYLHLIINGSTAQLEELNEYILSCTTSGRIKHYQQLKYNELIEQYCNASALLIPLTSKLQDKARFPQKISEYLASGNPIITTGFGEILYYFKNFENALIAEKYDVNEYSKLMNFVIEYPDKAKDIGIRGKEVGYKYFNYSNYGYQLIKLIEKVVNI